MPPLPKHPERRQGSRRDLGVVSATGDVVPAPPAGLLAVHRDEWTRLWESPLAGSFAESDVPALERLFQLRDEALRHQRAGRKRPTVIGSQGQEVLNPVLRQRDALLAEIRQLEDRFGLSPRSRLQLGITLLEQTRSLTELNQRYLQQGADRPDPRDPRPAA